MGCGSLLDAGLRHYIPSTTTPNGVTPNNSYSFTVSGVDANGVVSSNTGSTTNK